MEGALEKWSTPMAWEWELEFLIQRKDKMVAFENDSEQACDAYKAVNLPLLHSGMSCLPRTATVEIVHIHENGHVYRASGVYW